MILIRRFFAPSIRRRILTGFIIVAVLVMVMTAATFYQLNQVRAASEQIIPTSSRMGHLQDLALATSALDADLERFLVIRGAEYRDSVLQDLVNMTGALEGMRVDANATTLPKVQELQGLATGLQSAVSALLETNTAAGAATDINQRIVAVYNDIDQVKQKQQTLSAETLTQLQTTAGTQGRITSDVITQTAILGLAVFLITLTASLVINRTMRPISALTETATAIAGGDLNRTAPVQSQDEIGTLAQSFNTMTARLRDTIDSLETRVEMRTAQVQASADVGRVVTSILDPDQLLKRVVELITERFGLYYTAAFTLDPTGQWAVLREASGPRDSAWLLKQAGHRLEITGNSMVGASIRDRQARIALDVGTEAMRFSNPLLPETRSEVALPLIVGDQVLGALDVQSIQAAAFDETSTAVLQNMADQIAVALNNAAQYQLEQQRAQQTTQLLEASVELGSQTEATSLYNRIVEVAANLLHADSAALWQPVEESELELLYAVGPLKALIGQRAPIGEGIAGRVHATSLALRLNDARSWRDAAIDFGEVPVRAVVAVPMVWQGEPVGVLVVAHSHQDGIFSADDGNVAQLYAAQTSSTLANMRLLEQLQSTLDNLGTANRRLTGEVWQTRLRGREISYEYRRTTSTAISSASLTRSAQSALSLALPIELRGQPIGQIILQDDRPQRELTEDERSIVQEVAQRMSLALESARLFEQTQAALGEARRLAQREQMINRITSQLRAATTVDEVLHIATDEMRRAVRASWAAADLTPPTDNGNGQGDRS